MKNQMDTSSNNWIVSLIDYIGKGVIHLLTILGISFIESIILILALIGSIAIIRSSLDSVWQGKLISFILTFIISWILSKISNNRELKEEQKKFAIISYRHGKNLSTKMDISAEKYKCFNSEDCAKKESCLYFKNMNEIIEDLLIFKNDTEENMEDFSRYIGKDIIRLDNVEEFDNILKELNSKLQDENYPDKAEINKEIDEIKACRELEFNEVNEELKVHYMKRNKRNKDLEKIIKNRKDILENISNDKLISKGLADALRSQVRHHLQNMTEGQS